MVRSLYDFASTRLPSFFNSIYAIFEYIAFRPISAFTLPDTAPNILQRLFTAMMQLFSSIFGSDATLLVVMLGSGLTFFIVFTLVKWVLDVVL